MLNLKTLLFSFSTLIINITYSQFKVSFVVKQPDAKHSGDSIFIAGNFNNWDPGNKEYMLTLDKDGNAVTTLSLAPGNYEYKFTRGDWAKAEADIAGKSVSNRAVFIKADTTIHAEVHAWSDDFKQTTTQRNNTASEHVRIVDTAFYIPQLNRHRRIWIYLPPSYFTSGKNYPVLYMHDGQNLFDDATSYAGEWGIDEYLDSISSSGKKEVIVIGIDNGLTRRMNEYNPYNTKQFGSGEGNEYVDFLVRELKPYIDKHYHTLSDKKNTYIAGSSMAGLISFYAVLKYPKVFGGAGIFSPSFWIASGIDSMVQSHGKAMNAKLFFYVGGNEGKSMLVDMDRIIKKTKKYSASSIKKVIDEQASHNEAAWRKYFNEFYEWVVLETNFNESESNNL